MDAERLEKMEGVLMDYAVGETSTEVSAMVEALMEREELVRRKVEEWRRIVGDARGAMREKMKVELPAFDAGRMVRMKWRGRVGRGFLWGAGMAACVGVGVWLGSGKGVKQELPPVVARVNAPMDISQGVASVKDFWSVSRLKAYGAAARKPEEMGVSWRERIRSSETFGGGL